MKKLPSLPDIPEQDQTPVVKALLALIEQLVERVQQQDEEIALPLKGKTKKLTRNQLINYFGKEICELTDRSIDKVLETISLSVPKWKKLINISFLSQEMKDKYKTLLETRLNNLGIE